MHQHFLRLCFFGFPVPFVLFNTAHGERAPLCPVSAFKGRSLDSFLLPFFPSLSGKLGREGGGGRVTKYCINYNRWNEQLDNRMRTLRLLDQVDDTRRMKWQDPATINVCYLSSQTGNRVDNRSRMGTQVQMKVK